ncbi:helix-turn-helix domain-containing protein [Neobacillus pocheonensis]|uniref:Helix-turn-helix domain-containing protein n=1 Tax=Neobacillus pocheonensis TaxID=363869 RepID=A0ABT0W728_9BACI|nr:helix-turn-helix domain-containing protein [Neobacillus pocheonensis]
MDAFFKVNEVAKSLGITPSTIKKYYLLFEQYNYIFKRHKNGQLMFSEVDIELFKKLIDLKNKPGMNVSKAVEQLLKERGIYSTNDVSPQLTFMITEINHLKQLVTQQNQTMEKLQDQLNRIEEHRKIDTRKKLDDLEEDLISFIKSSMMNWQNDRSR